MIEQSRCKHNRHTAKGAAQNSCDLEYHLTHALPNKTKISHRWRERGFASTFYLLISNFYFSCRPAVGSIAWLDADIRTRRSRSNKKLQQRDVDNSPRTSKKAKPNGKRMKGNDEFIGGLESHRSLLSARLKVFKGSGCVDLRMDCVPRYPMRRTDQSEANH